MTTGESTGRYNLRSVCEVIISLLYKTILLSKYIFSCFFKFFPYANFNKCFLYDTSFRANSYIVSFDLLKPGSKCDIPLSMIQIFH